MHRRHPCRDDRSGKSATFLESIQAPPCSRKMPRKLSGGLNVRARAQRPLNSLGFLCSLFPTNKIHYMCN